MKYVLDSSVAFRWPVVETDTDKARRLRDAYRHGIHELLSPDIFPVELGHALTRAERQGRIVSPEAARFWADVMRTAPRLQPSLPLTPRAIDISSQMRVGV